MEERIRIGPYHWQTQPGLLGQVVAGLQSLVGGQLAPQTALALFFRGRLPLSAKAVAVSSDTTNNAINIIFILWV